MREVNLSGRRRTSPAEHAVCDDVTVDRLRRIAQVPQSLGQFDVLCLVRPRSGGRGA